MKTKIKHVPITFETPEELAKALLDGRRFRYRLFDEWFVVYAEGCKFYRYKDEGDVVGCAIVEECIPKIHHFRKEEIVEEEILWEEDLDIYPKGILCWVWDEGYEYMKQPRIVWSYMDGAGAPYKDTIESWWEYATPVTQEEIKEILYDNTDS